MNKFYRLVFSRVQGCLIAVPECAPDSAGNTTGASPRRRRRALATSTALGLILAASAGVHPAIAADLPTGGAVVIGSGTLHQGADSLVINQSSAKLGIDWTSFDIGAGKSVIFNQPGSSAIALNRVIGNDPSAIYGSLKANGQVFLVNPNGVLFAPGASVDVGALVATTRNISNADFEAGNLVFRGQPANGAAVINRGAIQAGAGGYIALVGDKVVNGGSLSAPQGKVLLAAGDTVVLSLASGTLVSVSVTGSVIDALIENSGLIVAPGGEVRFTARGRDTLLQNVISNSGVVEAKALTVKGGAIVLDGGDSGNVVSTGVLNVSGAGAGQSGGQVTIIGRNVGLFDSAVIDASGHAGGGTVLIGGDAHGANPAVPNAQRTILGGGARIDASATANGDGGKVVLWSNEQTEFYGNITASAGALGGNGGWVETSSLGSLQALGHVDAQSPRGQGGLWLIDPNDITIGSSDVNIVNTSGTFTGGAASNSSIISAALIADNLNNGTNVTISTTSSGNASGVINVTSDIVKSGGGDAALTLSADTDILVNANITSTVGALNLNLTGASSVQFAPSKPGGINISLNGGFLNTYGGTFGVGSDVGINFLNPTNIDALSVTMFGRSNSSNGIRLGSNVSFDIDTSLFGLVLTGNQTASGGAGILLAGNLTINGTTSSFIGTGFDAGISFTNSTNVTAAGGQVVFNGGASNGTGVQFVTATKLVSSSFFQVVGSSSSASGLGVNVSAPLNLSAQSFTVNASNSGGTALGVSSCISSAFQMVLNASSINFSGASFWNTGVSGNLAITSTTNALNISGSGVNFGNVTFVRIGTATANQNITLNAPMAYSGTGAFQVRTGNGNITLNSSISAGASLNISAGSNISVNAAQSNGSVTGGDVLIGPGATSLTSGTVTTGTVIISSGNANSAAYAALVANGSTSQNKRYKTTAANGTINNSVALNLFYRVAPTLAVTLGNASGNNVTRAYDGTGTALGYGLSGVIDGDTSLVAGSVGSAGSALTSGAAKNAGTYTVTCGTLSTANATALNYTVSTISNGTITITPANITVTGIAAANRFYDGTTAATLDSSGASFTGKAAGDVLTVASATGAFADKNAGTGKTVTISGLSLGGADVANYQLASTTATTTANITAAALTVTAAQQSKVYDGTTAVANTSAYSNSGLFSGDSISGVTLAYDSKNAGSGNRTIIASNAVGTGLSNYNITYVSNTSSSISPATITAVTGLTASKVYDGTTTTSLNASAASFIGKITGDVLTVASATAAFADKNVGTGKTVTATGIVLGGADAGNYLLTGSSGTYVGNITPATLTVTAGNQDKLYDGTAAVANVSDYNVSGLAAGESISGVTLVYDDKNANYFDRTIIVSGAVAGANTSLSNYDIQYVNSTLSHLLPADLRIRAEQQSKVYDGRTGVPNAAAYSVSGLVAGESISGVTLYFDDKNAGTNKVLSVVDAVAGANTSLTNYEITYLADTESTITQAAITAVGGITAANRAYDGSRAAILNYSGASFVGKVAGDVLTVASATGFFADKNVGTAKAVEISGISLGGADAGNYQLLSNTAATTANITAALLTITAGRQNKIYDGTTAVANVSDYNVSGLVAGESITGITLTYDDKNVGLDNRTIMASGGVAGANTSLSNYDLHYVSSTNSTINPAELFVTAGQQSKVYDGTTAVANASTYSVTGLVAGESISGVMLAYDSKNAGSGNRTITASGAVADANTSLSNYDVHYVDNAASSITPATLTITAGQQSKVYDGTTAVANAAAYGVTGLVSGESIVSLTLAYADKNAGSGNKTITAFGAIAGANTSLSNYDISYVGNASSSISPATITAVDGITAANKVYDGTTAAVLDSTGASFAGKVTGDVLTVATATGSFADKNVAASKTVTISGITLGGADAGNYLLANATASTVADITAALLTVTASQQSKVYDGTTAVANAAAYSVAGLVSGESIASLTLAYADKNAGPGNKTITASAAIAGANTSLSNYDISYVGNTSSTISPATITAVDGITAASKVYDGTTATVLDSTGASFAGKVTGDVLTVATATGIFADKNVAASKAVTISGITLGGADAGNYLLANATASTVADITAALLTITAGLQSKVYDGTTEVLNEAGYTVTGLIAGESLDSVTLAYDSKNVGLDNKTVTASAAVAGAGTSLSNYIVSYVSNTSSRIDQAFITVGGITAANKTYDGSTAATLNTAGASFVYKKAGDELTIASATGVFTDANAGNGKAVAISGIVLGGADAGNYQLSSTSGATTANITAAALTVTAGQQSKVYDGTAAVANASAYSVAGLVAGESLGGVTLAYTDKNAGSGNRTITVSNAIAGANTSLSNYDISYVGNASSTITPATLTVAAGQQSKVYDGTTAVANDTAYTVSGLMTGESLGGVTLAYADKSAGTGNKTILASAAVAGANTSLSNYDIAYVSDHSSTITPALITSVSGITANKVYDGTTDVVLNSSGVTFSGKIAGDVLTFGSAVGAFSSKNVGTSETVTVTGITLAGADAANYQLLSTSGIFTGNITPAALTVTAGQQTKVYDGTTTVANASAYSVAGLVAGENLSGVTLTYDDKNAGSGNRTITASGVVAGTNTSLSNYNVSYVSNTSSSITPAALTVTAGQQSKIYDGMVGVANAAVYTVSGLIAGEILDGVTLAYSNKDAGTGNKIITVAGAVSGANTSLSNYNVAYVANTSSTISPAALTVTAAQQSKAYDGTTGVANASAYSVSGLAAGEALGGLALAYDDKNAGTGNRTITASGAVAGANTSLSNYNVTYVANTSSSITAATLTVTAAQQSKAYDGTTAVANASAYAVSGLVAGESLSGVTLAYVDKNAGAGTKTIMASNAVAGANTSLANYNVSYASNASSTITPAALTITAGQQSKTYDGTTAVANASAYTVSGLVAGESLGSVTLAYADKNAGTANKTVIASSAVAGANTSLANYIVSYVDNTSSTISRAIVSAVNSIVAANKVYDGATLANLNSAGASFTGKIAGDVLTVATATGAFSDKNVGAAKTVTVSGITLGGTDAGNYQLANASATAIANITAATLTVTAGQQSKTYDGTTVVTNLAAYSVSGIVAGESLGSVTLAYADKNAGSGNKTVAASNAVAGTNTSLSNYNVSYVSNSNSTISQATITGVSGISAASKVYDGNVAATLSAANASFAGKLSGDALTIASMTGAFSDKNVGAAKTVAISGLSLGGTDAGNYRLATTTATASANITAAILTVTAGQQSKVYDGTAAVVSNAAYAVSGLVAGESLSGLTLAYNDKNAGTGNKTITASNAIAGANTSLSNYNIAYVANTNSTISQAAITAVNGITAADKVYDGTTTATLSTANASFDGRVPGDVLTVATATGAFADANIGTAKTVTISGITLGGVDAGNYRLSNTTARTTANITASGSTAQTATQVLQDLASKNASQNTTQAAQILEQAIVQSASSGGANQTASLLQAIAVQVVNNDGLQSAVVAKSLAEIGLSNATQALQLSATLAQAQQGVTDTDTRQYLASLQAMVQPGLSLPAQQMLYSLAVLAGQGNSPGLVAGDVAESTVLVSPRSGSEQGIGLSGAGIDGQQKSFSDQALRKTPAGGLTPDQGEFQPASLQTLPMLPEQQVDSILNLGSAVSAGAAVANEIQEIQISQ